MTTAGYPPFAQTGGQLLFHLISRLDAVQRINNAETFFAALRADILHGGNQAYHTMAEDRVQMLPFETFSDAEG